MSAKYLRALLLSALFCAASPAPLMAQQGATDYDALLRGDAAKSADAGVSCPAPGAPAPGAPSTATLIGMLAMLGLVGGGAATYTWQRRRQGAHTASGALRHIHSLQLGQNHQVSLIEVNGRSMVVALTQGEIKLLETNTGEGAQLAQPALRAAPPQAPRPQDPLEHPGQAFDALLQRARHAPLPQSQRPPAAKHEDDYVLEEIVAPVAPPEHKAPRAPVERETINTQGEAANVRRGIENLRNQHRKTP